MQMADEDNNLSCKIVLIGETGVGKTSIINRLTKNQFEENEESTMGAAYANHTIRLKKLKNKELKVNIWDTAGQEQYRSLAKVFYKEAAIAILVYNITKRDTFTEMKNYWYKQLKDFGEENLSK